MKDREKLSSRLSFILISAGCAIGVGNVWKFPWLVGQNGGGIFILFYFLFLLLLGLPILTIEFSIGRASQTSPLKMYSKLVPQNTKWHLFGYISLIGNIIAVMFYTVISGWMLHYFVSYLNGEYSILGKEEIKHAFDVFLSSPQKLILYMSIITILGFIIVSNSLETYTEKITRFLMIFLIVIMFMLVAYSFSLGGLKKGLYFYLYPDFKKLNIGVIVQAMNQAFFSLGIGLGTMAIFASYIDKKITLLTEAKNIILLDTLVSLMSGFIIFPACFTYNITPNLGPNLIFVTLPNVFNNLFVGRICGTLFFLFMTFASFSSIIALFENIVAMIRDLTGFNRKKTSILCCAAIIILSIPCALGFNVLSFVKPFGNGSTILDLEDFILSNCILPIGSLIFVLFATLKNGFGWENFKNEANTGNGLKVKDYMKFYITYILPIIILAIFIIGITKYVK